MLVMNTDNIPTSTDKEILTHRRPWYFLSLFLLLAGVVTRQPLVFVATLFTLLIAIVPELWYRYALRHLAVRQAVDQQHLFFGEEVILSISIENQKLLPLPWLSVEDQITPALTVLKKQELRLQRVSQDMLATTWLLWPLQRVTRRYHIRCFSRGLHTFGPIRLRSSDPFGWLERDIKLPIAERLLIYPLVAPLETLGLASIHPFGDYASQHRLLEDPLQIAGVRDYQLGDEPRRIHWKATAHSGILQSKVYEPSSMRRLLVLLDVWNYSDIWKGADPDIQELSITVAASLAVWGLDEGYSVGVLTNSAVTLPPEQQQKTLSFSHQVQDTPDIVFDTTPSTDVSTPGISIPYSRDYGQYEQILSTLAQLAPRYTTLIERLLALEETMFPLGTTIVLVSATSSLTDDTLEQLEELRHRGAVVYLALIGHRAEKTSLETYNLPVYYLGGSEKWHELVATINTEKNETLGTSTTALQLD
ncbi:MAG: hypothetical protein NVS4B12_15410 [Ktedonobacteraceae bacterium]